MHFALRYLGSTQTSGTRDTAQALCKFLNYCATHPDVVICYHSNGMVLYVASYTLYHSAPKARIRVGSHYYLSDTPEDPTNPPAATPTPNGPVHTIANIIQNVVALAAKAEVGGLFTN